MDRYCEFCVNMRSVVYCKADAAYLCLSCDSKVHSANPLSNRHHRTLICEVCRRRPTYVQCYDHHNMFMCHSCDLSQHDHVTSQRHRKRVMNSSIYVGCPSARDLGALWGFDLNRFVDDGSSILLLNPNFGSNSSASANTSLVSETHVLHIINKENMDGGFILEQLVDLLRLETCDSDFDQNISTVIRCQQQQHNKVAENRVHLVSTQQLWLDDHENMIPNPCLSPFSQLEESETDETHLQQDDSFWQCKTRIPCSQLWSQNMQDLGVCEEPSYLDDLNISDIDLTFRNFEELFKIEQQPTSIHHQDAFISTSVTNTKYSSPKKARYTKYSSLGAAESSGISHGYESIEPHESVTLGGK